MGQASTKRADDYFQTEDLHDNLKSLALRGGGLTFISRLLNFFVQTVATIFLARILTPEDFGLVAMVTTMTGFLVIFQDMGLTDATIQKDTVNHQQVSALFWVNLLVTGVVYALVLLLAPAISWFYSEPRLTKIAIAWSLYLVIGVLSTQHIALLKRRMLFYENAWNEIVAAIISNVCAIWLAFRGWGYWALVVRQLVMSSSLTVGAWLLCSWRPAFPSFDASTGTMLRFGRDATGYFIVNYFARNLEKILIGRRYGSEALGLYYKAYYLFVLPATQTTTALQNVATATLSKLVGQPARMARYYFNAIDVLAFCCFPVSFFFMIQSENIVVILLGNQWRAAGELFAILAVGTGPWVIYSTSYWLHASLGRGDRLLKWGVASFLLTAIAIAVGLPHGTKGVAIAYTVVTYVLAACGIAYAGAPVNIGVGQVLRRVWRFFVASVLASGLCVPLAAFAYSGSNRYLELLSACAVYGVLYLALITLLHGGIHPIRDFLKLARQTLKPQGV